MLHPDDATVTLQSACWLVVGADPKLPAHCLDYHLACRDVH
jgi:hypothetical protein